MSGAVSSISNAVGGAVSGVGNAIGGSAGGVIGNVGQSATQLGQGNIGGAAQNWGSAVGNMMTGGAAPGLINSITGLNNPSQPTAPGVDPGVQAALQQQQQQAQQFSQNLPNMQNQAGQQLAQATNQQMGQNLNNVNQFNSARGLAFGGINQGAQQGQRANAATSLAQGREQINDQFQQASNQMNAAAIGSGVAVQQSQQAIQDQIYNQALTNMMNQNQAFGSLLGAGGMAAAFAMA